MRLLRSTAPAPDGASFLVAEHQRVVTLYHLARKDEISFALFDFRAGKRDFITLAEAKSHVREKGLGTQVNIDRVRAIFQHEVRNFLLASFWRQLQVRHRPLKLRLGFQVVLGWARWSGSVLLRTRRRSKNNRKKYQQQNKLARTIRKARFSSVMHSSPSSRRRQEPLIGKNPRAKILAPASKSLRRMKPAFSATILHPFSLGIRFTSWQRADAGNAQCRFQD